MSSRKSKSPEDRVPLVAPTVTIPLALLPEPSLCGIKWRTINVVILGVCFLLLFSAFNPSQSYQSTANKTVGQTSLGVLYLSFAITGFFAPTVVHVLTPKWAMLGGAFCYVFYMGANIKVIPELFYVAAGACGVGASILWTAQGSYLAKNSDKDTLGRNTGIFFGILQVNMVVGNLIGSTLRQLNQPYWILFTAFTAIGAVGAASFLVLRQTTQKTNSFESTNSGYESGSVDSSDPVQEQTVSVIGKFINTLKLLASAKFALLAPIIIYSGLSQAFFFGVYSKMVSSYDDKMTGFVFAVFGAFDVLGSFACGKLMDVVGRKPIFFLGAVFTLGGTLTLLMVEKTFFFSNVYMYFIIGAAFGISDGAMNGAIYGAIGNVFAHDVENGFGAFRLLQSSTTAAHFFAQRFLDTVPVIDLLILDSFLLLGIMLLLILDFCVAPLDPVEEKERSTTGMDD